MLEIIYEDDSILAVTKPAGIPTLPTKGGIKPTLFDLLIEIRPELSKINEAGIVHRLDNGTSGVVLVAKTEEVYKKLRGQISCDKKVLKEYIALVVGNPPDEGVIYTPIAHHPRKKKKMVVCETKEKADELKAREAKTTFRAIKRFSGYTLLSVRIEGGVRHQIRAHLASIGFPIAGDKLYQNVGKQKEDTLNLIRYFLHAYRLIFLYANKQIKITSRPTEDLQKTLKKLEIF